MKMMEKNETDAEYKHCNISEPSVPKRIFLLNKTLIDIIISFKL